MQEHYIFSHDWIIDLITYLLMGQGTVTCVHTTSAEEAFSWEIVLPGKYVILSKKSEEPKIAKCSGA